MRFRKGGAVALFAALFALSAGPLQAQIVNGGFETGNFNGWTTVGNCVVVGTVGPAAPDTGVFQAFINSQAEPGYPLASVMCGGIPGNPLATLCGIPQTTFDTLDPSGLPTSDGSAIAQTVTVGAGAVITVRYNFMTQETPIPNPIENDYSFFAVSGPVKFVTEMGSTSSAPFIAGPNPFNPATSSSGDPGDGMTGYKTFTYTFPQCGTYIVSMGVFDLGDLLFGSAVMVDSITITGGGPLPCGGGGGGGGTSPVVSPSSPGEGSFNGVDPSPMVASGATGSEGGFGAGGHLMANSSLSTAPGRSRPRFLIGPLLAPPGGSGLALVSSSFAAAPAADSRMVVFNANYRQRGLVAAASASNGNSDALPWVLLTGLCLGAAAALAQTIKGTLTVVGGSRPV